MYGGNRAGLFALVPKKELFCHAALTAPRDKPAVLQPPIFSESPIAAIIDPLFTSPERWLGSAHFAKWGACKRDRPIVSEILKFPDNVLRMSKNKTPEGRTARAVSGTKDGTVAKTPSRPIPVMTGVQWSEFIRLLRPDEQQAFMADVWKLINRYCQRIGGE